MGRTEESEDGALAPEQENEVVFRIEDRDVSEFAPLAPDSLATAGITESQTESLILKFIASRVAATGRETAEQTKLPFRIIADTATRAICCTRYASSANTTTSPR